MTLNEFRAWFDGFSEAIGDAPTPEQWAKIKAKLAQAREPLSVPSVYPRGYFDLTCVPYQPSVMPKYGPRFGDVTCGISNSIARN